MSKKLIMHSGGMDSTVIMLDYIDSYGAENVISLGFNYGQRNFLMENHAAVKLCSKYNIPRVVLNVPIDQIGGCSLINKNIKVTEDMDEQRSTVVPQRNAIFCLFAAAYAQENDCDTIVHGACKEDYEAYRDCRSVFFRLLEAAIQAGRTQPIKGKEDIKENLQECISMNAYGVAPSMLDLRIETPLINKTKEETVRRVIVEYGVEVYKDSYTCYNGTDPQCGKCPACIERKTAFDACGVEDPLK